MPDAKLLSECKQEDLSNHHAMVFGRTRIWHKGLADDSEHLWHWSRIAWWKGMWYPHRGEPSLTGAWGVYAGSYGSTGPGDAELTHFLPMPPNPATPET